MSTFRIKKKKLFSIAKKNKNNNPAKILVTLTWVAAVKMGRYGSEIYLRGRLTTFSDGLDVESKEERGAKDDISRSHSCGSRWTEVPVTEGTSSVLRDGVIFHSASEGTTTTARKGTPPMFPQSWLNKCIQYT